MEYKDLKLEDACLVHRYLYYVLSSPIISDYVYDLMEKEARIKLDPNHLLNKPGSSLKTIYPTHIVEIGNKLLEDGI